MSRDYPTMPGIPGLSNPHHDTLEALVDAFDVEAVLGSIVHICAARSVGCASTDAHRAKRLDAIARSVRHVLVRKPKERS